MLNPAMMLSILLLYAVALYGAGWWGDRSAGRGIAARPRALLYGLSLAALCSSWTYFVSVGDAHIGSWQYFANALGPILAITLGFPVWRRIARLAKQENVGSLADFLAARYGKSRSLGILATVVSTLGALPYMSFQLIGLSRAWTFAVGSQLPPLILTLMFMGVLTGFAILFGVRRPSLNQHNRGLVAMVALESCIKLGALLAVAGLGLMLFARQPHGMARMLAAVPSLSGQLAWPFWTMTLLCTATAFTLPRLFHLGFVALERVEDMRPARWLVPVYFILWPLATLVIGMALRAGFIEDSAPPDLLLLALPRAYARWLEVLALLGGVSAGAAMVVVEMTAISAMVSNELVLPWLARSQQRATIPADMSILHIRRRTTIAIGVLAWLYYYGMRDVGGPISLGLTALTASAQLLPALVGGIYWRRAHVNGARAGILGGMLVWALMIAGPAFVSSPHAAYAVAAPFMPQAPVQDLQLSILASLALNTGLYVLFSWLAKPRLIDTIQAASFVDSNGAHDLRMVERSAPHATIGDVRRLLTRFLGDEEAQRALRDLKFGSLTPDLAEDRPAGAALVHAAERVLAGVIGAPSARNVVSIALASDPPDTREIGRLLDDAAHAVHFSRELLQATLESMAQGVSVIDSEMRLVAWNASYLRLMELSVEQVYVGKPLTDLLGAGEQPGLPTIIHDRLGAMARRDPFQTEVLLAGQRVVQISGSRLGLHDYLTTFADITDLKQAQMVLAQSNEELEQRVRERTAELAEAMQIAEQATGAQRRFVAAASHDLVQPLHAARLFIGNALADADEDPAMISLLLRADQAVEGAHRLLRALLHLSQLETGALQPRQDAIDAHALLRSLAEEFSMQAKARGLELVMLPTALWVQTDRDLLRSVLQNLIINALRYTPAGRVVVLCRHVAGMARFEVRDTGVGISPDALPAAFGEFSRLAEGRKLAEGTGLGLSIVARISQVLDHPVTVRSRPGAGSVFTITIPITTAQPRLPRIEAYTANLQGLRVLCVEDEPDVLIGTKALIERWGGVVTALERAEAVDGISSWDVAIADYNLGGEDGVSLLRRLQGRVATRLLVSAMAEEALAEDLASEDIVSLQKPVAPLALQALLLAAMR